MLLHRSITWLCILSLELSLTLGVEEEWDSPISAEEMATAAKTAPYVDFLDDETLDKVYGYPDNGQEGTSSEDESSRNYIAAGVGQAYDRWPGGVIPYVFAKEILASETFTPIERAIIAQAMNQITKNVPCVSFVEWTNQTYKLQIKRAPRRSSFAIPCSFDIGRYRLSVSNTQYMSMEEEVCFYPGVAVQKFLHVFGAIFEHQRPDRDDYIQVNWNRIPYGRRFFKHSWEGEGLSGDRCFSFPASGSYDSCVSGFEVERWPELGYDLDSITHLRNTEYSSSYFSIEALNGRTDFGRSNTLSPLDIRKLRRAYGCDTGSAPLAIMIIGGQKKRDVELVLKETEFEQATSIANAPIVVKGALGIINRYGEPMVCGGGRYNPDPQSCHAYNSSNNTWYLSSKRLRTSRYFATAQRMPDLSYWIFGGIKSAYADKFLPYPDFHVSRKDMPATGLHSICAALSPSGGIYLISGRQTWRFETRIYRERFRQVADNPVLLKRRACGIVKAEDGSDNFIVVGGTPGSRQSSNATYIFHSANGTWTRGQDYPRSIYAASSVAYEDSFLVIGGISQNSPQPTEIFRYNPSDGSWVDTELRMSKPRKYPVVIATPNIADIC